MKAVEIPLRIFALILVIAPFDNTLAQGAFQNGDFESFNGELLPGHSAILQHGDTRVVGWTAIFPSSAQGNQVGYVYRRPDSDSRSFVYFFAFGSPVPVGIQQTLTTQPHSSYTVQFDLGTYAFNSNAPPMVRVRAGNMSAEFTGLQASGTLDNRWQRKEFIFTSDGSGQTTLSFEGIQGFGYLDGVVVIPEPPLAMLGWLGAVAMFVCCKLRR